MKRLALAAALLALAACHRGPSTKPDPRNSEAAVGGDAAAPAGGTVSIDVPGFKAKVDIPDLAVSAGSGDAIDGVPLYPGTQISGASVSAGDTGNDGQATIRYSVPAPPATVLAYYRDHATGAGYRLGARTTDSVSATKPDGSGFTVVAHTGTNGSTDGTLTASGR